MPRRRSELRAVLVHARDAAAGNADTWGCDAGRAKSVRTRQCYIKVLRQSIWDDMLFMRAKMLAVHCSAVAAKLQGSVGDAFT